MRAVLPALFAALVACKAPPDVPGPCELSFSDQGSVRVFAVGHHFVLEDAFSYADYEASFRRHMGRIGPCLSPTRPNLVVFPEDAGLIAWFIGRRAMLARGASSADLAFNAIYAGYQRQSDAYRARFPGISAARALTLALGDVAWRAMDETFGGIARDHSVWVITSGNVPETDWGRDPELISQFGDPEARGAPAVYVARSPEVFNHAILYAPDGRRVDAVKKAFLTDLEGPALLDLSNGPMATQHAFQTPFGVVGAAISRDAFYPPFLQRMEDLDVELVTQPEAWSGWTVPQEEGDWLPDVILASGWTHTQKHRAFRHNVTPMLTGNLFTDVFDGQVWITKKAEPSDTPQAFVGSQPLPGWVAIGPWAEADPGAGSLDERRTVLRAIGEALLAGSGDERQNGYVDSLVGADLQLFGTTTRPPVHAVTPSGEGVASIPVSAALFGHQVEPDVAYDGSGRAYAVWADNLETTWRVRFSSSNNDGAVWTAPRAVASSAERQRRPAIAATGTGRVAIAWQEGEPGEERIQVAISSNGGTSWTALELDGAGGPQWEPDVAFGDDDQDRVVVVWTDFRGRLAPRIRRAASADLGATWSASEDVDAAVTDAIEASQYQPTVVSTGAGEVVAWIDYRDRSWTVRARREAATSEPVTPPSDREILDSDPQLVRSPGGELSVVWDDQRERRGHHDVRAAVLGASGWGPLPIVPGGAESGAFVSRFRPAAGAFDGRLFVVFQDLAPSKNALSASVIRAGASTAPVRFDDSGAASNQLTRPRVAVRFDAAGGLVVFEDDRDGWSRIRASRFDAPAP